MVCISISFKPVQNTNCGKNKLIKQFSIKNIYSFPCLNLYFFLHMSTWQNMKGINYKFGWVSLNWNIDIFPCLNLYFFLHLFTWQNMKGINYKLGWVSLTFSQIVSWYSFTETVELNSRHVLFIAAEYFQCIYNYLISTKSFELLLMYIYTLYKVQRESFTKIKIK